MKYVYFYFCLTVFLLFFTTCSKKTNKKLANDYYKLSLLELGGQDGNTESLKKALINLDLALNYDDDSKYLALKASILFKLNQLPDAKKIFEQILAKKIDDGLKTEILNNYACLLAQLGNTGQALKIWADLQNDKNYLTPEVALFNQSKVYFELNEPQKAKGKLLQAVFLEPGYLDAHYSLAQIFVNLKEFDSAKKELTTVLFLEPTHETAQKLLDSISI
ncbi:MAG: hypothetical protein ABIA74_05065 [bacterium]